MLKARRVERWAAEVPKGEEVRAALVADGEQIAEPGTGDEEGGGTALLQQGIG